MNPDMERTGAGPVSLWAWCLPVVFAIVGPAVCPPWLGAAANRDGAVAVGRRSSPGGTVSRGGTPALTRLASRKAAERVRACIELIGSTDPKVLSRCSALARTDAGIEVRAAAMRVLVHSRKKDVRELVAHILSRSRADSRRKMVEAIAEEGVPALSFLFRAAGDDDPMVRGLAMKGIASCADARFLTRLDNAIGDPDPFVRLEALKAVVALAGRDPSAWTMGTAALDEKALETWGLVLDEKEKSRPYRDLKSEATDLLRKHLKDKSPSVRRVAFEGLIRLGARGMEEVLSRGLADDDAQVRKISADELLRRYRNRAPELLGDMSKVSNSQVRMDALRALARLKKAAIAQICRFLDDGADHVRRLAVQILAGFDDPSICPRLADLLDDSDESIRRKVAWVLGRSGLPAMEGRLAKALTDPSPAVRRQAIESLASLRGPDVIRYLSKASRDEDATVRRAYIVALGRIGGEDAARLLVEQLADKTPGTADAVQKALMDVGDYAVGPLCSSFRRLSSDPVVLKRVIDVLGRLKARKAVPLLCELLRKPGLDAGALAVQGLCEIGDPSALPALEDYFVRNDDLPPEEESKLRRTMARLGRRTLMDLELRRHLLGIVLGLVVSVVLFLVYLYYRKWQAAERLRIERMLGRGAATHGDAGSGTGTGPGTETFDDIRRAADAYISSSRDTAGVHFYRRGLVNLAMDELLEARRDLDEALRLCSEELQPAILFFLGRISEARGDHSYAFRMYTQSLRRLDKELLGELMSSIAAESPNDVVGNIEKIVAHLPFHGEISPARIMGEAPWERIEPARSGASPGHGPAEDGRHLDRGVASSASEVAVVTPVEGEDAPNEGLYVEVVECEGVPDGGAPVVEAATVDGDAAVAHRGSPHGVMASVERPGNDGSAVGGAIDETGSGNVATGGGLEKDGSGIVLDLDPLSAISTNVQGPEADRSDRNGTNVEERGETGKEDGVSLIASQEDDRPPAGSELEESVATDGGDARSPDLGRLPPEYRIIAEAATGRIEDEGGHDDGDAYFERGMAFLAAGMLDEAEADLEEAVRLCDGERKCVALFNLGKIRRANGQHGLAMRNYALALRLHSPDAFAQALREIGGDEDGDLLGDMGRMLVRLPFHGDPTPERILGTEPWQREPSVSGALAFGDPAETVAGVRRRVPWERDGTD